MLPTGSNHTKTPCSVVSSNCVSWQGPDIPCVGLCKGDTVTDVVTKLGEVLCDIDTRAAEVNVNVTCLGGGDISFSTYNDLMQYVVDELCNLYTIVNNIVIPSPVDLTASVAACLQAEAGGVTLNVVDYAELIGQQFCLLETSVTNLSVVVVNYGTQITNINNTLITLPSTYAPLNSSYVCLSTGTDTLPNIIATIEQELCDLEAVTGTPADLALNIQPYCNLTNEQALATAGTMASAYPEWNITVSNLGDTIKNLWITICDLRERVEQLTECCGQNCADIILSFYGELDGTATDLTIYSFAGSNIPSQFNQCVVPLSDITITDGVGGSYTTVFSNIEGVVDGTPFTIENLPSFGIDTSTDFVVTVSYCFYNSLTNTTCNGSVTFNVINTVACPPLTLTSSWDGINSIGQVDFSFPNTYIASSLTRYRLTIYSSALAVVSIVNTPVASVLPNPVTGVFTGLIPGNYTVVIEIIALNPVEEVETVVQTCPPVPVSVYTSSCFSPINVEAYLIN
jgi:hypothetical protein